MESACPCLRRVTFPRGKSSQKRAKTQGACPANFPPPKKTDGSESFRPFAYAAENQLPLYALAERADAGSGLLLAEHMDNPVQVGGVQPPRQREADEGRHVGDGAVVVLRVLLIGAGRGGVVEGGRDGA